MILLKDFTKYKAEIHEALCDSLDTRTVILKMREIINSANIYMKEQVRVLDTETICLFLGRKAECSAFEIDWSLFDVYVADVWCYFRERTVWLSG